MTAPVELDKCYHRDKKIEQQGSWFHHIGSNAEYSHEGEVPAGAAMPYGCIEECYQEK